MTDTEKKIIKLIKVMWENYIGAIESVLFAVYTLGKKVHDSRKE